MHGPKLLAQDEAVNGLQEMRKASAVSFLFNSSRLARPASTIADSQFNVLLLFMFHGHERASLITSQPAV